jgi:two-component system OmpR family sensor kinase
MKTRPLRFTSIKYRLALLFLSITAGAILVIYFYVVPQLQSSLTSEKLDGLQKDAATYSRSLQQAIGSEINARQLDRLTRQIAEKTDAGVTVLGIPQDKLDPSNLGSSPPYVISDSREATSRLELSSNTALAAARDRRIKTTTRSQGGSQLAQAAKPLLNRGEATQVVVFSESLNDVSDNVSLIQRQILIAGAIALMVSIIGGYGASNALARRVKRLERAAGEVAAGNFHEPPIPVDSEDELGQLARAFNEMQRRLAGLDRARKEFIANASHELRTPIFSLGGFVELLQDEDIDERTRAEFLVTMSEQVARLQKLTTELLDLSRLDAGSLELELEPVPLATIARQVAGEFAAAAARQEASIEILGEEVEAECDPERVGQVVRALLDNALSHTGHGTSITVTTGRNEVAGRHTAVLRVADDGPGIEEHRLPNVFDRFHSGDSGQGSGLGLAIARELTERMLGDLQVSSRPGNTVFTLTLPLARELPPLPGRRAASPTERPVDRDRKPERTHA